ncbi:MAG: heavy-metal-associated domain-containing protein [candidate division Zixibacteria bacterium]|nr:heavy-metal-associated domain-containing protein [candidate division Zixibacteria bacterium]MDH3938461.1 heavy-metal-associated domain-containing protein [candidate division Zixibacteria bacterium]MDH4033729.1 heavy-metal-associated domain-containing protein [candidate division Zixibacteria bacterium]
MINRITLLTLVLALSTLAIACGGGKNFSLTEEPGTEIRIYEVFGMDCPGCHVGVEKLVNRVDGVVTSVANWTKKQIAIKVRSSDNVSDEAIFDAIKEANFTPGKRLD